MLTDQMNDLHMTFSKLSKTTMKDIKTITVKVKKELLTFTEQMDKMQSPILKNEMKKVGDIAGRTLLNSAAIMQLHKKYVELSNQFTNTIYQKNISICRNAIDNIERIDVEASEDTKLAKQHIEVNETVTQSSLNDIVDDFTLNHYFQTVLLNCLYLSFLYCYLPFTINDKKKYKKISQNIVNTLEILAGTMPTTTSIVIDVRGIVKSFINIVAITQQNCCFFDEDLNNTDDVLLGLQKQQELFLQAFKIQTAFVECLNNIIVGYEDALNEII